MTETAETETADPAREARLALARQCLAERRAAAAAYGRGDKAEATRRFRASQRAIRAANALLPADPAA